MSRRTRAFDDFTFHCSKPDCVRQDPHGGDGALHHIAQLGNVGEPVEEVRTTSRLLCRSCTLPADVRRQGPDLLLFCSIHGYLGSLGPLPPQVVVEHAPAAPMWVGYNLRPVEVRG